MSYFPTTNGNVAISVFPGTGQYLYSTGANTNWTTSASTTLNNTVTLKGKTVQLDEDADIRFGDTSLMETLREIKTQLGMLTPDPELESEFEELRACAREYERLRTKFLEQKRVWDTLKQHNY